MATGRIYKALSGFFYVKENDSLLPCRARGKFKHEGVTPLVGDEVEYISTGGQGIIDAVLPRKNEFLRPPVANLDVLVIIASRAIPVTDPFLVDKMTAIAEHNGVEPVVLVNKSDLIIGSSFADIYRRAGFKTVETSAETGEGIDELRELLRGKLCAFTGNSGVGKSSLLNALDDSFSIAVSDVSLKLGRGKHTTRHVELHETKDGAIIADTPGFSSFDTESADLRRAEDLQYAFRDFAPYIGECRFTGCSHTKEQDCAVLSALREGRIEPTRHESYVRLYEKLKEKKEWEHKKGL
ncbi:MAG: ribosome small subunit-dependent GTPase A [Oscillospiraceae bacterium]|nr:ribosome small subunit-dependent GTPase A [Oscillospiraceae bacterium]